MSNDSFALTLRNTFASITIEMPKNETLNLRVSGEFKRRLAEEAKKEQRSVTNYIEAALTEFWTLKASGATPAKPGKGVK
jgi:hypothetical protein